MAIPAAFCVWLCVCIGIFGLWTDCIRQWLSAFACVCILPIFGLTVFASGDQPLRVCIRHMYTLHRYERRHQLMRSILKAIIPLSLRVCVWVTSSADGSHLEERAKLTADDHLSEW